jgi:hypothetical protein
MGNELNATNGLLTHLRCNIIVIYGVKHNNDSSSNPINFRTNLQLPLQLVKLGVAKEWFPCIVGLHGLHELLFFWTCTGRIMTTIVRMQTTLSTKRLTKA